ncbi:MAG: hypothetical protein M1815_004161 [Lichina confinis]|nr:MAG: hypothetical protein M1815_004161 [Lichina confinis]
MSEPIPESIPTFQDPKSRRPTKKRALTPVSAQANQVTALFAHPERDVVIPASATREAVPKRLAPPPEIVANVQGSSAGAGSGEFHVYKASRRREYERLRLMEEENRKEKERTEFERKNQEWKAKDESKTNKNKAKREKAKLRKMKAKAEAEDGSGVNSMDLDGGVDGSDTEDANGHGSSSPERTTNAKKTKNGEKNGMRPRPALSAPRTSKGRPSDRPNRDDEDDVHEDHDSGRDPAPANINGNGTSNGHSNKETKALPVLEETGVIILDDS